MTVPLFKPCDCVRVTWGDEDHVHNEDGVIVGLLDGADEGGPWYDVRDRSGICVAVAEHRMVRLEA